MKCGSGYWVKSVQSWNMVTAVMNLPLNIELCVGPKHWSAFDWGGYIWHTESKYLAYWCRSSLFPHVPFFPLPSTPGSTAFRREIIRSGTKVFLSHCRLTQSWCLRMLGDFRGWKDSIFYEFVGYSCQVTILCRLVGWIWVFPKFKEAKGICDQALWTASTVLL